MKIAKKILKWGGITLLILIIAMIAIPFFFKDTIKEKVIERTSTLPKLNLGKVHNTKAKIRLRAEDNLL